GALRPARSRLLHAGPLQALVRRRLFGEIAYPLLYVRRELPDRVDLRERDGIGFPSKEGGPCQAISRVHFRGSIQEAIADVPQCSVCHEEAIDHSSWHEERGDNERVEGTEQVVIPISGGYTA